jgi:hypothetical protein
VVPTKSIADYKKSWTAGTPVHIAEAVVTGSDGSSLFAIQDADTVGVTTAGVLVSAVGRPDTLAMPALGDVVEIDGLMDNANGLLQISGRGDAAKLTWTVLQKNATLPAAITDNLADFRSDVSFVDNDALLGKRVTFNKVDNFEVQNDKPVVFIEPNPNGPDPIYSGVEMRIEHYPTSEPSVLVSMRYVTDAATCFGPAGVPAKGTLYTGVTGIFDRRPGDSPTKKGVHVIYPGSCADLVK